jgi:hypothetical protein
MTEHPYGGAEGRPLLDLVIKGMSVVDCDGTHVGTVDKVEGGHLKILRPDQRPRNQHHMSRRVGSSLLMTEFV